MSQISSLFLSGQSSPSAKPQELWVGQLSMLLEEGGLRRICYGGVEVLRGIYSAVRDQNWGTVSPVFSKQTLQQSDDFLKLEFEAHYQQNQIDFRVKYWLEVHPDKLKFSFSGQAQRSFLRNRIGFCILHPMNAAGARCRLGHVDGSQEAHLPTRADASQPLLPFTQLKALEHEVSPNFWARLEFEGDAFEMEDQRNWTDASFKTYCTPLGLPFPVLVEAGTQIEQSLTLSFRGSSMSASPLTDQNTLTLGQQLFKLPAIGTEVASHGESLTNTELERLRALKLSHLRVELDLAEPFETKLNRAVEQSHKLDLPFEIALTVAEPVKERLDRLARALERLNPDVVRFLVYPSKARENEHAGYLAIARGVLSQFAAPIFGGTNSDFYFLNGYPVPPETVDGMSFGLHPQAHAFDNASLVETLETQTFIAREAKRLSAGRTVAIGPITFKPRWNPYATNTPAPTPQGQLPSQVDPRQLSLFGAGWTLGCLKALTQSGSTESLTLFETTGWRGLMETQTGSSVPDKFPSFAGGVFPLYHVLADLADFAGGHAMDVRSSHPQQFDSLMLQKDTKSALLLANFSDEKRTVELDGFPPIGWLRKMRDHTVIEAMTQPEKWRRSQTKPHPGAIELPPYGYIRLEFALEK